jgi:uncharacterized membrane protein YdbT with pleckstrin-like domain
VAFAIPVSVGPFVGEALAAAKHAKTSEVSKRVLPGSSLDSGILSIIRVYHPSLGLLSVVLPVSWGLVMVIAPAAVSVAVCVIVMTG